MAISDVLSDAVASIDEYLNDQPVGYFGEVRARIVAVRDQMDAVRRELDTPPSLLDEEQETPDA